MSDASMTEEQFWARVEKSNGCWIWKGAKIRGGYGRLYVNRNGIPAHRFSWEIANRQHVPKGFFVCHHCDNPPCVNPEHLFLGTHIGNMLDMKMKGRSLKGRILKNNCHNGHPLSGTNLYMSPNGWRGCRKCRKQSEQKYAMHRKRRIS